MKDPFELVFDAYIQGRPKITMKESWKKIPKNERIVLVLYFLTAIAFIGVINGNNYWLTIGIMLLIIVESVFIILISKKNRKKCDETISRYKKEVIQPLRNKLKQYQLHDSESIMFLCNRCEKELNRETEMEAFVRRVKSFFLFWGKVIGIAVAWTFFRFLRTSFAEDTINIQEIAPSELLIKFLNLFTLNEALFLIFILSILVVVVGVFVGFVKMCFEDGINSRRKKIRQFANALEFLLVEVKREELAEDVKKQLPSEQSKEKKGRKSGKR